MPETANYGFEYETPQSKPGITLTGDIDGSAPILAEQVDSALAGIDTRLTAAEGTISLLAANEPNDTGWLVLATTPAAGFTLTSAQYRWWGPVVMIRVEYQRSGADIVASAAGNVVGDPLIATITTIEARPSVDIPVLIQSSLTSGAGLMNTAGAINLTDMHSNSTIATGQQVRIAATYFGTTFS